jgi:uncharacterized membrane protein
MKKSRGVVAGVAVTVFLMALFLGADLLGHLMAGAEYRYEVAMPIITIAVMTGALLFTWNIVTYKRSNR